METPLATSSEHSPLGPSSQDLSNLQTLAIFHFVVGGILVLGACVPLIHMFVGLAFILGGESMFSKTEEPPPQFFGWIFFIMGLAFFLIGQAIAISVIVSGRYIQKRKNHLFTFIVGCLLCTFFPFGTVLGVFTIVLLSKETIKQAYGKTAF